MRGFLLLVGLTSHSSWNSGFSLAEINSIKSRVSETPNKIGAADPGYCAAVAGIIAMFKLVKKNLKKSRKKFGIKEKVLYLCRNN